MNSNAANNPNLEKMKAIHNAFGYRSGTSTAANNPNLEKMKAIHNNLPLV
ncbi:MAG: hypothetical protein LBC85_09045 [Fibromonadaceae bacterium]|nr:hypothetical protein [Fibromonadaceae bacterium]